MIRIDSRSSKPIYEQIVDQIKENIIREVLRPGDKLPSVREMSVMIRINPNTVSKAYKDLEREKVIEVFRGKGTYVSDIDPKMNKEKFELLKKNLKEILIETRYLGISKEDFIKIIDDLYENLKN